MAIENLRDLVAQLSASATALAVLGAELQARVSGKPLHPALRPHTDVLLREVGAEAALEGVTPAELAPFIAELRCFWLIDHEFLENPYRAPGWSYGDPAVLDAGGQATEGFPNGLSRLLPQLDGLAAHLESDGGSFLDVGTGVGRLAIAMARKWPSLRVTGIDVWGPSLAKARENVANAGLAERIQLREQAGEDLSEERAFDLAWIPAPFVPPAALGRLIERVQRAIKPGGWLLLASAKPGEGLRGAAQTFHTSLWGGRPMTQLEAEKLLADAGLAEVKTLPGPPRDFKMIVAGRRAK